MPAHDSSPTAAPRPAAARANALRAFGRFQLRELLGRSDRTMLWIALDPRLGHDMLLLLPRSAPADAGALAAWLADARHAARLNHPHLAAAVEIGAHDQWPYVACERGLGQTLPEWLAANARPPHNELAGWLCQALEGLAFAHEAGVAHHDLQAHHLLIDERGQVRVLGIGAGAHVAAGGASGGPTGLAVSKGMPMDPAGLRAQRTAAERDVLALGLIAHQWLAGAPPLDEPDTSRVIERLAPLGRDMVRLPWTTPQPVSEVLRTIVNRATHNQPRQRYLSARTLHHALSGWRAADAKDNGGPVALLIDRLRTVGHLPATPGLASTVARLSRMERQRTSELAELVLLDLALSLDLMRQTNSLTLQGSPMAGNGPVLTIRRAIAMVGLDGVRRAAASLRAWPGPLSEMQAVAFRQAVERVRLAGHVAQLLRPAGYDPEVVFLLTVLQNLGRLLVHYHFPDDAEQIHQLMRVQPGAGPGQPDQPGMNEQAAAFAVLGCDIDAITLAVARHWGLADEVLHMMRRLPLERPVYAADADDELLRATSSAANEAVDVITQQATTRIPQALEAVAKRYAKLLGTTSRDLGDALRAARHALDHGLPMVDEEAESAVMPLMPDAPAP